MRSCIRTVVLFFSCFFLTQLNGCKTRADNSSQKNLKNIRIAILGFGGWSSCRIPQDPAGSRIDDSFKNLTFYLDQEGATVSYLLGCLSVFSPANPIAPIRLEDNFGQKFKATGSKQLAKTVKEFIDYNKPDKIYIIGHSYGGWMSLKLLEDGVRASSVFTLDPIDAESCLPLNNVFYGLGQSSKKCQRAPLFQYDDILYNTNHLVNLWQPQGLIHSGLIITPRLSDRVINFELDINHSTFQGDMKNKWKYAHPMIGSYPVAWGIICQRIALENRFDASACKTIDTDANGQFTRYVSVDIPDITL